MNVIKFGGSLFKDDVTVRRIVNVLEEISEDKPLIIVPGGGVFADAVRKLDKNLNLWPEVSHELAIKAMDMTGILLTRFSKKFRLVEEPYKTSRFIPVLLASKYEPLKKLKPSWDVTSDSVAALVAGEVKAKKCMLLKSVNGIYCDGKLVKKIRTGELKKIQQSCVDKELSNILEDYGINCFLVNGLHPERIKKILKSEKTTCTEVIPSSPQHP